MFLNFKRRSDGSIREIEMLTQAITFGWNWIAGASKGEISLDHVMAKKFNFHSEIIKRVIF